MTTLFGRNSGKTLCLVTDLERAGSEIALVRIVKEAVRGGVNMVQVRGHELSPESLEKLATAIVDAINDEATVTVNGSPEIAESSGAAGVHLRETDRLDRSSPKSRNPQMLVGKSAHGLESALAAETAGADYIVLGTVFPSASHPGGVTGGVELIREVSSRINVPIIGIGGITVENAAEVMEAGASGVAVISAIIGAPNPFDVAQALASAINLPDQTDPIRPDLTRSDND